MQRSRRQRGVTMIELVISIVVIAIALSALTIAISEAVRGSADPMLQEQAGAIAQAYLEEVSLRPFCDPSFDPDANPATTCAVDCAVSACSGMCGGPLPAAETRAGFDDVCDYDGIVDNGARDQTGNLITGLGLYTVRVDVSDQNIALGGTPALNSNSGRVVLINVTVSHPQADDVVVSGYRANY